MKCQNSTYKCLGFQQNLHNLPKTFTCIFQLAYIFISLLTSVLVVKFITTPLVSWYYKQGFLKPHYMGILTKCLYWKFNVIFPRGIYYFLFIESYITLFCHLTYLFSYIQPLFSSVQRSSGFLHFQATCWLGRISSPNYKKTFQDFSV